MKKILSACMLIAALCPINMANAEVVTVSYHYYDNGSEVVHHEETVNTGERLIQPNDPIRSGYAFVGWYSTPIYVDDIVDDSSISYAKWQFDTPVGQPFTLYARWYTRNYTVTYHANGGAPDNLTEKVYYSNTANRPTNPYRANYRFDDWYITPTAIEDDPHTTTPYNFNYPVLDDLELFARWDSLYIIHFETAGGQPIPYDQQLIQNNFIQKPATNPRRQGYDFVGWYTESGKEPYLFTSTPVSDDLTLIAHWTANNDPGVSIDAPTADAIPSDAMRYYDLSGRYIPQPEASRLYILHNLSTGEKRKVIHP